ncbi:MAG TPA: SDR family NAD(P)-dependent oxidoreductase, partial [Trebonia sp.]
RAGMAAGIYAASPVFAAAFDQACGLLEAELGIPVAEVALGAGPDGAGDARADQTLFAQPGLFAVQAGLVALLAAAEITPAAVAGHSVGEVAAAYAAGVLTLEDACALVAARARLMQVLPAGGAMCAVAAPETEVAAALAAAAAADGGTDGGTAGIAAVNGPAAVVVSGDEDAVRRAAAVFAERGVRTRTLRVSHAFHSARMDPALPGLNQLAARLVHAAPSVPWAGALDGELVTAPDPAYWAAAARRPVRFADAVATLAGRGIEVFLEIGPDGTLSALGPAIVEAEKDDEPGAAFVPLLRKDTGAAQAVTAALAAAHAAGVRMDWTRVLAAGHRVELPTYAFQNQRYWPDAAAGPGEATGYGAAAGGDGAGSASEARFWAAVDGGHLRELAAALEIDEGRPFSQVVPVLAEWRRRERGERASSSWRYAVSWVPAADPGPGVLPGTWLLAVPEDTGPRVQDAAAWCAAVLAGRGATVRYVLAGRETAREELAARVRAALDETADTAAGDPGNSGTEDQPGENGPVAGVLSLLALDEAPLPEAPGVAAGLAGTAGLVQALSAAGLAAPLWAATQGAVAAVPGDTVSRPAQAQVWGLGPVAALELPETWGGLVDLPPVLDERAGRLLGAVLAGCGEDQAAVRPAGVFGRRMVRAPAASAAPATERWAPSGAVLVTGGTGAIGGHVARWLASRGAPKVVLASRSGPASAGAAALSAALAGAGAAVEVTACDSSNHHDLTGLVARLAAGTPPLSAVFHAAGVASGGLVLDTAPADLAYAMAAKAGGAAALDAATADLSLEAFVLFSSGAAIWGSANQAGYAAANAYLNALAENRQARGLPATSIAWGLWGGGGMGDGEASGYLVRLGLREMDPAPAMHQLAQVLDRGQRMATVADIDWDQFASVFTLRRPSPLISALPEVIQALAAAESDAGPGDGELARQLSALPERERQPMLTGLVRAETAAILRYPSPDAVEADLPFNDLGMDSLTAVELRNRLSAATGLRLPATMIFDHPTPAALAGYLLAKSGLPEEAQSPVFDVLDELKTAVSRIASGDADHPAVVARIEV